jgi:hypothetical protein
MKRPPRHDRHDIDDEQWQQHVGIGDEGWGIHAEQLAAADCEHDRGNWQQQRDSIPPPTESPAHDSAKELAKSGTSVGSSSDKNADNIREPRRQDQNQRGWQNGREERHEQCSDADAGQDQHKEED